MTLRSKTTWARRGLIALGASFIPALAACHVTQPADAPAVVARPMNINPPDVAELESPNTSSVPQVDPGFTRALAEYSRAVRRYETAYGDTGGRQILGQALAKLAAALEAVPQIRSDVDVWRVAQQIRRDSAYVQLVAQIPQNQSRVTAERALAETSEALTSLANGPYASAPAVRARALELSRTVTLLRPGDRLREDDLALRGALRDTERVLSAMYAALARGEVR